MNSTRTFPAIISSKRSSPYVSSLLLILNIQFIIELPAINDMKEVVSIKWDDYESSIKMKWPTGHANVTVELLCSLSLLNSLLTDPFFKYTKFSRNATTVFIEGRIDIVLFGTCPKFYRWQW